MSPSTDAARKSKLSPDALKFVIVGAGICGLAAGLALRQQGHDVTLLESAAFSQEVGAAIHMGPNCNGLLRRMGVYLEKWGANEMTGLNMFTPEGEQIKKIDHRESNKQWLHPWLLVLRTHLHTALRTAAVAKEGKGKPCELHLASRVVRVDPTKAEVEIEDGKVFKGDVLLGADGVHSVCRKRLDLDKEYEPFDSGHNIFRFLIPMQELRDDPMTRPLIGDPGNFTMSMAGEIRFVMYPCNHNETMNFSFIYPGGEGKDKETGTGWEHKGDKSRMLAIAEPYSDGFKAILAKAPEDTIKSWKMLDMDILPTWVNQNMALMGDAAHPFLPHLGQGGAQAIEDAMSIGALFPLGTRRDEINERLNIYEKCRKYRADRVQQATRRNGMSPEELEAKGLKYDTSWSNDYNFDYDEWHHSTAELNRHLWHKQPYTWDRTTSFGPGPGPTYTLARQPSAAKGASPAHQVKYAVRFKTSKTYLETLFPTSAFSFFTPGTIAQASLVCFSRHNIPYLGGRGYKRCVLFVHGVKYTDDQGSEKKGTFVPLVFEDLADRPAEGDNEIDAPKWLCDINISETSQGASLASARITLAWQGTVFGEMELGDFRFQVVNGDGEAIGETTPKPRPDEGLLAYRCARSVGYPEESDQSIVFMAHGYNDKGNVSGEGGKEGSLRMADKARVGFSRKDWAELPTVKHVVDALADMPVVEVLEASVHAMPWTGDGEMEVL